MFIGRPIALTENALIGSCQDRSIGWAEAAFDCRVPHFSGIAGEALLGGEVPFGVAGNASFIFGEVGRGGRAEAVLVGLVEEESLRALHAHLIEVAPEVRRAACHALILVVEQWPRGWACASSQIGVPNLISAALLAGCCIGVPVEGFLACDAESIFGEKMLRQTHAHAHEAVVNFPAGARDAGGGGCVPVGVPGAGEAFGIVDSKRGFGRADAGE